MKKFSSCRKSADSIKQGSQHNRGHRCNTVELCVCYAVGCHRYIWVTPSMSGYICGSEWAALFTTRCRRMTADKWIRSVTVTVASGGPVHCVCVSVSDFMGQNGLFVCHDAELTCDTTSTWTRRHTLLCFSYPVSANTTLICILSVLKSFLPSVKSCLMNKYVKKEFVDNVDVLLVSHDEQTTLTLMVPETFFCCSEGTDYHCIFFIGGLSDQLFFIVSFCNVIRAS